MEWTMEEEDPFTFELFGTSIALMGITETGSPAVDYQSLFDYDFQFFSLRSTPASAIKARPKATPQFQNKTLKRERITRTEDKNSTEDDVSSLVSLSSVSHHRDEVSSEGNKRTKPTPPRLRIQFTSLGERGEVPQFYGRKHCWLPHGLSGRHEVYHERWMFEIAHWRQNGHTLVEWKITNLTSHLVVRRLETVKEAAARQSQGKTIANYVVRESLNKRAIELENQLANSLDNPLRVASLTSKIKALRPNRCAIGLLFFGLLHPAVEERVRNVDADIVDTCLSPQDEVNEEESSPNPWSIIL